jgi:hypothetical protein
LEKDDVMILGMSISTFTTVHTIISLIGIVAGFIVLFGMFRGTNSAGWTALFLAITVLTSVTGFMFPRTAATPAQIVGGISLVLLAIAIVALYVFRLRASWRWIYVITAVFALYLNTFVGVVQTFQKVSFFSALAPTQSEPPFLIAQTIVLALFILAGFLAVKKFHPDTHLMVKSPVM